MNKAIYINGVIGSTETEKGVELLDVVAQVNSAPEATAYDVYINSEGGFVDVGFDIYNYLRSIGKPITTIGTGVVASIATVIFLAGDTRKVTAGTQFMIHNPWLDGVQGNASELESFAADLKKIEKKLTDHYKSILNVSDEVISPLLRDETYLTEEQLQTLNFVNVTEPYRSVAKAYFKPVNNMSTLTEKDKNWISDLFTKALGKFRAKAKMVTDATGVEIVFADLADDGQVEVGMTATANGTAANGEYVMPSGETYVFEAGTLTEIKMPEGDDSEIEALKKENQELKDKLAQAEASAQDAAAKVEAVSKDAQNEILALKRAVNEKIGVTTPNDPPQNRKPADNNSDNRFKGKAEAVRNYLRTGKK